MTPPPLPALAVPSTERQVVVLELRRSKPQCEGSLIGLGLRDNGQENGNYNSIGLYRVRACKGLGFRDNGKENGNYCNGLHRG